jgi:hypothetical protein
MSKTYAITPRRNIKVPDEELLSDLQRVASEIGVNTLLG